MTTVYRTRMITTIFHTCFHRSSSEKDELIIGPLVQFIHELLFGGLHLLVGRELGDLPDRRRHGPSAD